MTLDEVTVARNVLLNRQQVAPLSYDEETQLAWLTEEQRRLCTMSCGNYAKVTREELEFLNREEPLAEDLPRQNKES